MKRSNKKYRKCEINNRIIHTALTHDQAMTIDGFH